MVFADIRAWGYAIYTDREGLTVEYCKKCGKPLEITHIVMGRLRTHPCACLCEIRRFEKDMQKWKKRRLEGMNAAIDSLKQADRTR